MYPSKPRARSWSWWRWRCRCCTRPRTRSSRPASPCRCRRRPTGSRTRPCCRRTAPSSTRSRRHCRSRTQTHSHPAPPKCWLYCCSACGPAGTSCLYLLHTYKIYASDITWCMVAHTVTQDTSCWGLCCKCLSGSRFCHTRSSFHSRRRRCGVSQPACACCLQMCRTRDT